MSLPSHFPSRRRRRSCLPVVSPPGQTRGTRKWRATSVGWLHTSRDTDRACGGKNGWDWRVEEGGGNVIWDSSPAKVIALSPFPSNWKTSFPPLQLQKNHRCWYTNRSSRCRSRPHFASITSTTSTTQLNKPNLTSNTEHSHEFLYLELISKKASIRFLYAICGER